jgi:protoporphyrinogen/coproporphyrinogen III oxidase
MLALGRGMTGTAGSNGRGADAAVVGGGISGVATTWFLERLGRRPTLIERSSALGGKNIGRRYTLFRELVASLGLDSYEHFGINSSRIDETGRLRAVDGSRKVRAAREILRGARPDDVVRLARLARTVLRDPDNRFLGSEAFTALGRKFDDRPLGAHFGKRFAVQALRPMTVRMNGAEPDEVYLGNFGTNLGMLLDGYEQLEASMSELFSRFQQRVGAELDTAVEGLVVRDGRIRGLELRRADGSVETRDYDDVVLAMPAGAAARLIAPRRSPTS